MRRENMSFLLYPLMLVTFWQAKADVDDVCGYAPLCGEADQSFGWGDIDFTSGGNLIRGVDLSFQDCCSLKDTQPEEDCQIINPTGESYRTLTSNVAVCGNGGDDCDDSQCAEYQLVIDPTFLKNTQHEGCCDSCTCYGDPQCVSFDGTEKMWVLCDGREIPHEDSIFDMCRITKRRCEKELDHVGNQCVYKADDPLGRNWNVGKNGSPCVPNSDSPASRIVMYSAPAASFNLELEQGERGIIKDLYLELSCGNFHLNAEECLDQGNNAWSVDGPGLNGKLPEFFSYNDVVHGYDTHWSIVDPDSGISIAIRCHGNRFDGDSQHYVARMNVEELADPVPGRSNTDGFCVTNEFDTGLATTSHTQKILDGDHCVQGLQESNKRDIFRAMCRNPALPTSAHDSCIYHFCSEYYAPLYSSVSECQTAFDGSLADAFCHGVTYSENDAGKCVEQWFDIGAVETIQQYYDDENGCTTQYQETLEKCQSGIIIQYWRSNQWNDGLAIPSDYCSDNGEIRLSYCDYPRLFNRRIRVLQKEANYACGPANQCKAVEGFLAKIALVQDTAYPTQFPTTFPTKNPTKYPTPYPSIAPSPYPTPYPNDAPPSPFPTRSPARPDDPETCPQDPICGTETTYVDYDDSTDSWHIEMPSCCPQNSCPPTVPNPYEANRTQGTEQWYCGHSDGAEGTVDDSHTGRECVDEDELEIMVMFSHDEDALCCKTCTCFGDPRCYSFDNEFEEFILCDGRTAGATVEDRCIIRKSTCESLNDHEGNQCIWSNPNKNPPDYSDEDKQDYEEAKFSVARYGSPCRYNPDVSERPVISLYEADGYELSVEQGERGYIQTVFLTMGSSEFEMGAERCLDGDGWERVLGDELEGQFHKEKYGLEYLWVVEDVLTGINLKIRCTGTLMGGKYTTKFINIEAVEEPDFDRISRGSGFCASGDMPEKALATYEHTDDLRDGGYCDNWNENVNEIMQREVIRIIGNNPGITSTGVTTGYKTFCQHFFLPAWSSSGKCVDAFLEAKNTKDFIEAFCKAVTREVAACQENLELMAEQEGYKEAFHVGYETYIVNFEKQCVVRFSDLPTELRQNENHCETGAVLQWYNPRRGEWLDYVAFPDNGAPCSGYTLTVDYDDHPKLFKNPLRLVQAHNFQYCNSCVYASAVDGWFQFNA